MTDTAIAEAPAPVAETATEKRYRATKEEMVGREQAVIDYILNSTTPITIQDIADHTSLSYPRSAALVRNLLKEKQLEIVGKQGRKDLLKARKPRAAKTQTTPVQSPEPKATVQKAVAPPIDVTPVNVNDILRHLHYGRSLHVVGFHMADDGRPTLRLQSDDGASLTVTVVSPN